MDGFSGGFSRYVELLAQDESRVPLDLAAATIACTAYPDLNPSSVVDRLKALADRVRERGGGSADDLRLLATVNTVLFRELGLRGNADDYYDPRNSFLNDVLDRGIGIPITLSVVMVAVGRRVGLALQGVGFPGHFLVRYVGDGGPLILDPFNGGRILERDDLTAMLARATGRVMEVRPELLRPASTREILIRMLNNLRTVYDGSGDLAHAAQILEWMVVTEPTNPVLVRDRGILYWRLQCAGAARSDLEAYLQAVPQADDADAIREILDELGEREISLH